MSSSDNGDSNSHGSSQSQSDVSSLGGSLVEPSEKSIVDSSSRKGVKSKIVIRLHKTERMPVNHNFCRSTDESGNRSSQSGSKAENMAKSHKGGCPVDPTSQWPSTRHQEDLALGSGQPPPGNTRDRGRNWDTGQHNESGHDDPVIQQSVQDRHKQQVHTIHIKAEA